MKDVTCRRVATLALLLVCSTAEAQSPSFRASTPDSLVRGMRLDQFASAGLIHLSGPADKIFPATELIELRREDVPLPEHPRPPFVILTSAERLPLDPDSAVEWKENRLHARPALPLRVESDDLRVPLPYVAALCLDYPAGQELLERRLGRMLLTPRKLDRVFLNDGDEVQGHVLSIIGKECKIETGGRTVTIPVSRLALIMPRSTRLVPPRTKGVVFRSTTRQGARIAFQNLDYVRDRSVWSGKTSWGASFEFPFADLVCIRAGMGKAVYLSDIEPKSFTLSPGLPWPAPLGRDFTFLGRALRLSDGIYAKGVSIPPGGQATYALDGKFRWFEASLGLDPLDGKRGAVRPFILVDGKPAPLPAKELTFASGPWEFRIDVSRAKTLTLRVEPGSRSIVEGVANWGAARLIR